MPVARITDRLIRTLVPGAKPYVVFDADLKGFGVRVLPTSRAAEGSAEGAKARGSFVVEYRPGAGGRGCSKRRFKFGEVGVLSAEQARKHAKKLLAEVRLGADPAAERTAARKQMTVAALIDEFMRERDAKLKPRVADLYRSLLDRFVRPKLGSQKAEAVTRAMVARVHSSLNETGTTANRMLSVVGSMYVFAEAHGIVPAGFPNPARKIKKYTETARERFLTGEEFERLGEALRLAETSGIPWAREGASKQESKHLPAIDKRAEVFSAHAVAAIRLLLFTGCRLREILHLEWGHVDLDRALLFLPDSKTGRRTIVLNAPAMAILASLPRIGRYVIAGAKAGTKEEGPRADLKKPWAAVCRHAGLKGVRIHDLRHTHASVAAGGGLGLPVIGKLLGHKQAATTARYAHLDIDPVRRASEFVGSHMVEAMGDLPAEAASAEVVPLRTTKAS